MEKDIGKIKKNDQTDIVIRIDDFGGKLGLTIREFTSSEGYTGFTKSGTRIPLEALDEFKTMVASIKPEDLRGEGQAGLSETKKPQPISHNSSQAAEPEDSDDVGIADDGTM